MFCTTPLRPIGREFRMTPRRFETPVGCQKWPLKSPLAAIRTPRSRRSGSVRTDGRAISRDVLTKGIPMYSAENKTTRTGKALGEINLSGHATKLASKTLFAEADQVIGRFPCLLTRERKNEARRQVLRLFLAALAASRLERAV